MPENITPFHGVVPPIVTPFNEDFTIDTESLRTQVERMIKAGIHGLFALGSSAEVAFLTRENRQIVLDTIIEQNAGRLPVAAGVIDMTTPRCLEHVAEAPPQRRNLNSSPTTFRCQSTACWGSPC